LPRGLGADRGGLAAWAGDGAGRGVDDKVALAQPTLARRALGDGRQDLNLALGQLGANRPDAVGGVIDQPRRAAGLGLAVDEVFGLRTVLL
jgi:hypothetical protein